MKILGVADSDSYVKWGAAALARTPADWEKSLVVIETPLVPTEAQRIAAVEGLPEIIGLGGGSAPPVLNLTELTELVAREQPEVIFLSLRGPLIRVVLRAALSVTTTRPVIVSGLPGISIPATRKALTFRSQVDLIVLHSKHEIHEFIEVAKYLKIEQEFGLATLPFLESHPQLPSVLTGVRDEIVFAAQAKVPRILSERIAILNWLAECARRHPDVRVVVKLRAIGDEKQTHAEQHPYDALLAELHDRPQNLVAEAGSMSAHLSRAIGLVTVSSTAMIEAAALGIPGLALDDFGVSGKLINTVFENSNLFGSSRDLIDAAFRHPDPAWLDDNYFHDESENDWIQRIELLVVARAEGRLRLKRQRFGRAGGRLRHVWDRKRALGALDRSPGGYLALVIGYPARQALRIARRTRGLIRGARRRLSADPTE
ncbi:MAG: DUF6716 putative glycosyltransferase [Galbitalea sp.]